MKNQFIFFYNSPKGSCQLSHTGSICGIPNNLVIIEQCKAKKKKSTTKINTTVKRKNEEEEEENMYNQNTLVQIQILAFE